MKALKDLANEMALHPRTVKRWWKKLGVPPTVAGHGCHRWSDADAAKLLDRWAAYWRTQGHSPALMGQKFSGTLTDPAQLVLSFPPAKKPGKISSLTRKSK